MVQTVRESAVRVFAATGLIGRNRPFSRTGHVGTPDREPFHTMFHSGRLQRLRTFVPHAVVHGEPVHQHHGKPLALAIHVIM